MNPPLLGTRLPQKEGPKLAFRSWSWKTVVCVLLSGEYVVKRGKPCKSRDPVRSHVRIEEARAAEMMMQRLPADLDFDWAQDQAMMGRCVQ